jgi:hypothetical protein
MDPGCVETAIWIANDWLWAGQHAAADQEKWACATPVPRQPLANALCLASALSYFVHLTKEAQHRIVGSEMRALRQFDFEADAQWLESCGQTGQSGLALTLQSKKAWALSAPQLPS